MFSLSNMMLIIIVLFVIGMTAGYYNGHELDYSKIQQQRTFDNSSSPILKPVYMMVDGGVMLMLELSKVLANQMIEKGWDFNKFMSLIPYIFWGTIAIIVVPAFVKLFVYVYILRREFKEAKREKAELKRLRKNDTHK